MIRSKSLRARSQWLRLRRPERSVNTRTEPDGIDRAGVILPSFRLEPGLESATEKVMTRPGVEAPFVGSALLPDEDAPVVGVEAGVPARGDLAAARVETELETGRNAMVGGDDG